jgi:hypothetical protein
VLALLDQVAAGQADLLAGEDRHAIPVNIEDP